jgi:hypothetical protein
LETSRTRPPADLVLTLIRQLSNHLQVLTTAYQLGFVETALEAQLSAQQAIHAIREHMLRGTANPSNGSEEAERQQTAERQSADLDS